MGAQNSIPVFALFGETNRFPDVVHCEEFVDRASNHGWRISPHRHADMAQIFMVEHGRVAAQVDRLQATLCDGQFLFIPEQKVHAFDIEPFTQGRVFSLPSAVVKSVGLSGSEFQGLLADVQTGQISKALSQLSDQLASAATKPSRFRAQLSVALAHSVLSLIAEGAAKNGSTVGSPLPDHILALDDLIQTHLCDGWTASDYAEAMSISTGHLSRLCRQATGLGATAYIELATMTEATRLLAFTQMPVAEIGYRLGYEDPSYFARRFKRFQKQTPSAYRSNFVSQSGQV